MSANAATLAVVLAFGAGWFARGWVRAVQDNQRAQDSANSAGRALWRARGAAALVAAALIIAIDFWFHGHGR